MKDILKDEMQTSFKVMEDKFFALLEPIQRKVAEIEKDLKKSVHNFRLPAFHQEPNWSEVSELGKKPNLKNL